MINNRQQAGRRRGRGGQQQQRPGGNSNRNDNGSRIDNRSRGNATQLHEKYKMLARDAQMQGDRVNTEYYLQFADHYFRVLSETKSRFEEANPRPINNSLDEDDGDYEQDGDTFGNVAPSQNRGQQDRQPQQERPQYADRQQGDRQERAPRQDRQGQDGQDRAPRQDRQQADRQDGAQPRFERPARDDRAPREERAPRADRVTRDDRGPREDRAFREDRVTREPRAETPAPVEAAEAPAAEAPAEPRRRGRPRRDAGDSVAAAPASAPETTMLDVSVLPPSLSFGVEGEPTEAPKPRRKRVVRPAADDAELPIG